jgi:putative transposase
MRDVYADFEIGPAEFNGEPNHVLLLVNFPAKVATSGWLTQNKPG